MVVPAKVVPGGVTARPMNWSEGRGAGPGRGRRGARRAGRRAGGTAAPAGAPARTRPGPALGRRPAQRQESRAGQEAVSTREPRGERTEPRTLAGEGPEVGIGYGAVADLLVDAVRSRVREVGVEEAEPPPRGEQPLRQRPGRR